MKPEDELIDALLREQARKRDAYEELLASIEKALDDEGEGGSRTVSKWRRALPLSIAAGIAIGGAVIYQQNREFAPELAVHEVEAPLQPTPGPALADEVARMEAAPPEMAAMDEAPPQPRAMSVPPAPAAGDPTGLKEQAAGRERAEAVPSPRMVRPPASRKVDPSRVVGSRVQSPAPLSESEALTLEVPVEDSAAITDADKPLITGEGVADGLTTGRAVAIDGELKALRQKLDAPSISDANKQELYREWQEKSAERHALGGFGDLSRENYGRLVDQPWKSPWDEALSTFSIDVDTASYTNIRRMIREGRPIQPDAVRIEELVNYFDYTYPQPEGDSPFAVGSLLATCPWQPAHLLARVSIKGREIENNARPASNLVFLIDVSGSMQSPDKLPMLKRAMATLIDSLDERDRVGIVVYAGTEGVALSPTELTEDGKSVALRAIGKLESGGSTNGGAGISRAYQMALKHRVDGGVNRVILATDGDFNVGTTGQGQLVDMVKGHAAEGVSLSVLGFGTGNLNDAMLEAITNDGNGNYFYVDGDTEAKRVFEQKLTGTLVTIAKDVKIQVEFNPGKVKAYRLIGYANRVLRNQDFNDDKVDAGDIGAGHTVTAFYEIVPVGVDAPDTGEVDELKYQRPADRREVIDSDEWLTLKLRYKHPEGEKSRLIKTPVTGEPMKWEEAGTDFRMASAVALFGMKLRGMDEVAEIGWDRVEEIARPALADDLDERRAEFLGLVGELE